jgi:hypothetical protein
VLLRAAAALGVKERQVGGAIDDTQAVKREVHERAGPHPGVTQHEVGPAVVVVEAREVVRRVELCELAVVEVLRRTIELVPDAQLARKIGRVGADGQAADAGVVEEQAQPRQPLRHGA